MGDQHKESGRRLRVRERRRYTEEYGDEEELLFGGRAFDVDHKLVSEKFDSEKFDFVRQMTGDELTIGYIQQNGFEKPIIIKEMKGLGMKIPSNTFSVGDVKQCVGSRRVLDVMDVETQRDFNMTMKEWCVYYDNTDRDRLLNVISLEFSHTKLEQYVDSPHIVKQVDWIDWVWPKHLKQSQTEGTNSIEDMKYPKVQKYCLMSVKGCYTDFHIDFGGTSVWYHILKGRKVFWLIPPTERNIQLYEQWVLSGKQSDIFFGDTVEQCARVHLEAGNTFFIPTGWIHAVFTPEDSLVFGGNFLHSFSIEKQLRVAQVEDVTRVPAKFRYPFYTEVLWYVLARYVYCLMNKNHLKCNDEGIPIVKDSDSNDSKPLISSSQPIFKSNTHLTPFELSGLKAIIMWLQRLPPSKRSLPELILSAELLLNDAQILIDEHSTDSHQMAITGRPVLFWSKKATNSPSITSQLRQIKPPSYALKQMRQKEAQAVVTAPVRPESPPTRPISSNQYTISSGSTINQDLIPSSFAGLIAQTGVNHFQPFIPITNAPILSSIGSLTAPVPVIPPVSYMPSSLPPPPPLISTNPIINSVSYQTTNATQTTYTSLPQMSEHSMTHSNHNSNSNSVDRKPLNGSTAESNNHLSHNFSTTTTQSQQSFANFFISGNLSQKRSSPQLTVNEAQTLTTRPFPVALPPSGFHSTAIQSEPFVSKMVNSATQSAFVGTPKLSVSTGAGSTGKTNSNDSSRRRRTRCKKCDSCLRADCGECHFCKDMKKFGGPGRMKQSCIARQCLAPVLPHTACCMICGRDGWEKLVDPSINDETASSLMECSQCWEIVHPFCLNDKFPQFCAADANINEDLPNSWECPRCAKSGSKTNNKYSKSKSNNSSLSATNWSQLRKEDNVLGESEPPEKKFRLSAEESPPTTDDEDDGPDSQRPTPKFVSNNSNNSFDNFIKDNDTEDTDNSSSSSHTDGPNSLHSYLSKPYSLLANSSSAHVRSCARFPLLSQGLKQMSSPSNNNSGLFGKSSLFSSNNSNNNNTNSNKSEVKGLAALMNPKKKSETSRDRLFKSLKGLKKSSELSVRFGGTSSSKKSNKSNSSSTTPVTTTLSSSLTTQTSCSSNSSNSSISSHTYNQNSQSLSSSPLSGALLAPTLPQNLNIFAKDLNLNLNEPKREIHDESTDDEDLTTEQQSVEQITDNKQSNGGAFYQITEPMVQRELIQPKYVVRPAPLECDISESDESDVSDKECEDESNNDTNNNSVNRKARIKAKHKFLRKFRTNLSNNLVLERDVMCPVMKHLAKPDLLNCMRVCRLWNGFTMDPKLWLNLDLSRKKITSIILMGIVRRQPRHLNLSWTSITRRQLFWLICRLPHLQSLSLAGCSSSTVSALSTCNCPLMESLDLSWSHSLDDDLIAALLSAPNDSRPGLMETKTRLRFLAEIKLSGLDITDKSIRLITQHLPFVTRIDISNCNKVTDMGIAVLATAKAKHLVSLNIASCSKISDISLDSLRRCQSIELLDVRECPQVNRSACHQFISQYPPKTKLICN